MNDVADVRTEDPITVRQFAGKRAESPEVVEALSAESQAGLRQFSLERMMGYGIGYADAVELRARIVDGQPWRKAANDLAEGAIAELSSPTGTPSTHMVCHLRASALLRMSQALMLEDTEERRRIVFRAADHFALGAGRRKVLIETDGGPLAGWLVLAPSGEAVGSAIVIGGIEGWAMDFDSIGDALAQRGINALMLDGPGQGESRILHGHHLTTDWMASYRKAIDFLEELDPGCPIGIVGNSMGGSIVLAVANADARIVACCNNGGIIKPSLGRGAGGTFFAKMVAFCNTANEDEAVAIWDTVKPTQPGPNADFALLVIQGGLDPLVSVEHGKMLMGRVPVRDKRMELFSDGDHCIYNHAPDRDIVIADWMRAKLFEAKAAKV